MLVTFLWSTSFIIIKLGLKDIPPLTYAGLRYTLAFICLLPFTFKKEKAAEIKNLTRKEWIKLVMLGLLFYSLTQGAQFIGLALLPSVTVSLILNFTPLIVAIMGIFFLAESPGLRQWCGALLFIAGILVYFYPVDLPQDKILGIIVMLAGVAANSASAILGRNINRGGNLSPLVVTVISMGIGSILMLILGIVIQGIPAISFINVLFLVWLSVVNTAFAFTLWNLSLQKLTAMESSIINGTMLIQIAFLAWIFLNEQITVQEAGGMIIAAAGAVLVQLKKKTLVIK